MAPGDVPALVRHDPYLRDACENGWCNQPAALCRKCAACENCDELATFCRTCASSYVEARAKSLVMERRVLWFLVGLIAYHVLARVF